MGDSHFELNELPEGGIKRNVLLVKDHKTICRAQCLNVPAEIPPVWNVGNIVRPKTIDFLPGLPHFFIRPDCENSFQQKEWGVFLGFLQMNNKVAIAKFQSGEFYILPPDEGSKLSHAVVAYRMEKSREVHDGETCGISRRSTCALSTEPMKSCVRANKRCEFMERGKGSNARVDKFSPEHPFPEASRDPPPRESTDGSFSKQSHASGKYGPLEKNYVQAHPSYLRTLGQAHSGWIFGAIAELVDNSRDAKATSLKIDIDTVYSKNAGKDIPMLSVIDDGHGMTHHEIVRMISFGHKQPDADDPDHIGRFGVGFKTGAMRLGRDVLVLTQTANSRSIAFLSQSLNEGKDNLEIPIVSYRRQGNFMEVDTSVQSETLAKYNLRAIKEFSPFNKYLIGEKSGLFREKGTGTQIYIWNLDKWGSHYSLEWDVGICGGSSFHQGDILIRSKRIRSRPGQTSTMVPLDYSLRYYLEVIFLDPRMRIYVQGSLVRSRPLAKSLSKTFVENGIIMGRPVELTLGHCQLEWEQSNCGIFLYWHGRLIEAYKRVGGMVHSADMGRGVIGNDGNGHVWVHSNKQGFQDCEPYALLEEWVRDQMDTGTNILIRFNCALHKADHEWVQCDKCRKWRMLDPSYDSKQLPQEWFCYMKPFNRTCQVPEQKVERGVITVSTKRAGFEPKQNSVEYKDDDLVKTNGASEGGSNDDSSQTVEEDFQCTRFKRLRRGPARSCKKT